MTVRITFTDWGAECLRSPESRFPFAYGYLSEAVRSHLDGITTADSLRTVLDALDAEMRRSQ